MAYVDGVVSPVPASRKAEFVAFSERMADLFIAHGVISIVDAWEDEVPEGKTNSMRSAVLLEEGECVVFSWMIWPDKAVRDAAWKALEADPELAKIEFPYDASRMIVGGFEQIVGRKAS